MGPEFSDEIALVLDYQFGDRLLALARSMPVYAVSSPQNKAAVNQAWDELLGKEGFLMAFGATSFDTKSADLDDVVAEALDLIEFAHGFEAGERPYTRLHIYGATGASPVLEASLAEYGFVDLKETKYGLLAQR